MSSNEVVKTVAKKLKYYFEIKRLEDGFDLSDVHQPQLDHPPLKARPALQYEGLHDRALKHYFSQPEVRVQLTQMHGPNGRGTLHGRREQQVRKMLDNYMKHYSFQKNTLPSCYYYHTPKGCKMNTKATGVLHRAKKPKNLIGGWPTLRSVPDQHISRGEATRLVNSATKILVASAVVDQVDKTRAPSESKTGQSAPRPRKGSRRPATAKYSWDSHKSQAGRARPKAYDDSYIDKPRATSAQSRPRSPTPSQSTATTTSATTATSTSTDDHPPVRPQSAKYRSRTVINVPQRRAQEEVAVIRATQTAADFDVGTKHDRQLLEKYDKLEEEVDDGAWCEYQVYVCTGTRIGSSTKAPIKLTMYGEKGRTKEFILNDSKRHKIPFQKGKEDLFMLAAHHIGRIRRIQIGHDRPELSYAWYLEGVTVYDMHARRIFQFPCEQWLSGQAGDKKTYRMLQVDREREFIDALGDEAGLEKSTRKHRYSAEPESSTPSEAFRYQPKGEDNVSTRVRPGDDYSDTDSSDSSSSGRSQDAEVPVNEHGSTPRQKKKVAKDDYEEKTRAGTVITLHSATDSQQVDEIFMEPKGRAANAKSGSDFLEGYKTALSASEAEKKRGLEREREMERALLQGKSIHEAVRDGDVDRVKDLLHHFPEMRDFKDESSWTPLHLAAARGNIELLRWLLTSEADINAETSTGYNAMHIAAMNGHVSSMMLLQAMGSSIFGLTAEKQSALHLSAKSGHLECVKWLVANRASLPAEDAFGRTALKLAEEFRHDACADFLRICLRELANPRSTFAMMQGQRLSQSGLPPIEEDTGSASSSSQWKDDVKGHSASEDSENEKKSQRKSKAEEKELEEKRKLYKEQHELMEDRGLSFLDSIRQDASKA
ncbi:uncharacterized protein LOC101852208 isoform X2 [Aplysia californica]|uniref:Uncharacterized protein LOC101852208 isoform X2 n=1 Tax=Aplysia californica TaxID=6500 RepID=A0ABM0K4S3_APLCA|nr:uncharacterized protein LOC101852208 isoform X2 [Aplysia californica]